MEEFSKEYQIQKTGDGSNTIFLPELNETYHSHHGAYREAMHVFIQEGIEHQKKSSLSIFELGFGTGLNALLTWHHAIENNLTIRYHSVEAYPISTQMVQEINYPAYLPFPKALDYYRDLHDAEWNSPFELSPSFEFEKTHDKMEDMTLSTEAYDIIFFDAFAPNKQAELWSTIILQKMYDALKPSGVLVTYCSQGQFKRNLKAVGFDVENPAGPPGKREMTRGIKPPSTTS